MTKSKSTKRAFVVSLLALTLCFAMLVGTTWAWFTDTVTSGRNRIYGGYLDVELFHVVTETTASPEDPETPVTTTRDEAVTENTVLFGNVQKWEPGVISYETFKVKNVGDVALKYSFNVSDIAKNTITKDGATHDLTEVIKVAVTDTVPANRAAAQALTYVSLDQLGSQEGNLDAGASSDATTIVLYWAPSAADDKYNRKNTGWTLSDGDHLYIDFGVTLVATQDTVEEDSFDDQYDKDALYPNVAKVSTAAAVTTALADDAKTEIIVDADIALPGVNTISGKTIDGNGKTITVSNTGSDCGLNAKSGAIENVTVTGSGRGIGTGSSGTYAMDGDLYLDNVTIDGPTYAINIGNGNGHQLIATNSTFLGWTSMANIDATFTNCTFGKGTNGDASNYAVFAIYDDVTFNNCTFTDGFSFFGRAASAGTITLNNCTHNNEAVTAANFATVFNTPQDSDFNYLMNQMTIIVDGVQVN